jgi:uracil-DNA glycosylase
MNGNGMDFVLATGWQKYLQVEMEQPYFQRLADFVRHEYQIAMVYPPWPQIFAAFNAVPLERVHVVILGQDPYHGPKQANGLSFSVNDGVPIPPSLRNIFLEIHADLGKPLPTSGNLMRWATQGVLLLNAILTVRAKEPRSHQHKGWERFTDEVIRLLSERCPHLAFLLWGAYAQQKGAVITNRERHLILAAAHPSPYSAANGFFGCRHFSQTNAFLAAHGLTFVDW